MKLLLDTHAFLWWVTHEPQLSSRARRILGDSSNEVYFSAVSGWEIAIKTRLGRLSLGGDNLEDFVAEQGCQWLSAIAHTSEPRSENLFAARLSQGSLRSTAHRSGPY